MALLAVYSGTLWANEPVYSREFSIKGSSNPVLALKIDGRIDCNFLNSHSNIEPLKTCSGSAQTQEMIEYNRKKSAESFLILKAFKGNKKQGEIISVNFVDEKYDLGHLDVGRVYLIFFHQETDGFHYEHCDAIPYDKIKSHLNKKNSYEKLVDIIINEEIMECPTFKPVSLVGRVI